MKSFDVQGIDLNFPRSKALAFIADPAQLPRWTSAFTSVCRRTFTGCRCASCGTLKTRRRYPGDPHSGDHWSRGLPGESGFRTWVYRVACNTLLALRKKRMEQRPMSFEEFGEDLARGLSDDSLRVEYDPRQGVAPRGGQDRVHSGHAHVSGSEPPPGVYPGRDRRAGPQRGG